MKNSNGSKADLIKGLNDIPDRKQNISTKNNKRIKPKKKLLVLIAAGLLLLLLLIAVVGYGYFRLSTSASLRQSQLHSDYVENFNVIDDNKPTPDEITISEFNLARIIIPAIGIDFIVVGGVDVYDPVYLDRGPVHFHMTDMPGTEPGNVVIGGHRSKLFGPPTNIGKHFGGFMGFSVPMHFHDLDLLDVDNEIHLDIDGYRFTYTFEWQKVVDKYDWSVIDEDVDYPALSLQTCEPKYSGPDAKDRLFIRAALERVTRAPAPE